VVLFKPADRNHAVRSVVHETSSSWATVVDQMRNRISGGLQVIKIDKWAEVTEESFNCNLYSLTNVTTIPPVYDGT
jgi:hypothetical protein